MYNQKIIVESSREFLLIWPVISLTEETEPFHCCIPSQPSCHPFVQKATWHLQRLKTSLYSRHHETFQEFMNKGRNFRRWSHRSERPTEKTLQCAEEESIHLTVRST